MGNLTSRETTNLLDHKSFKHIATNLGDLLQHHGEHEKLRAAESSERQQRRKAKEREEALKRPPEEHHHYHHIDWPNFNVQLTHRTSRRESDHYPREYAEEYPFEEEERRARRRNHSHHSHNNRTDYDDRAHSRPQDQRLRVHHSHGHHTHGHRRHGHRSNSRHPEPTAMEYASAYPQGAMAPSSIGSSGYSPRAPHARMHQPGSGSERGGRQPQGRRSQQPMQPRGGPPRGARPPMGMGPPPPRGMGPHPENHPFHMRGGPAPPAAGGDNGTFDEDDDDDADDGMDGPTMGGTAMGADAGMPGFRDGFDPERRMGRGMRRDGLGPEQGGPE